MHIGSEIPEVEGGKGWKGFPGSERRGRSLSVGASDPFAQALAYCLSCGFSPHVQLLENTGEGTPGGDQGSLGEVESRTERVRWRLPSPPLVLGGTMGKEDTCGQETAFGVLLIPVADGQRIGQNLPAGISVAKGKSFGETGSSDTGWPSLLPVSLWEGHQGEKPQGGTSPAAILGKEMAVEVPDPTARESSLGVTDNQFSIGPGTLTGWHPEGLRSTQRVQEGVEVQQLRILFVQAMEQALRARGELPTVAYARVEVPAWGWIGLTIAINGGQVSIRVESQSSEVGHQLVAAAEELQRMLSERHLRLTEFSVRTSEAMTSGGSWQMWRQADRRAYRERKCFVSSFRWYRTHPLAVV